LNGSARRYLQKKHDYKSNLKASLQPTLRDLEVNIHPTDRRRRYANDARIKDARKSITRTRNASSIKRTITLIYLHIYERNCSNKARIKIRKKRIARTKTDRTA
jgi:hypothetical protein